MLDILLHTVDGMLIDTFVVSSIVIYVVVLSYNVYK